MPIKKNQMNKNLKILSRDSLKKRSPWGTWVAQWVKCLPSAQVMIPGSWDQVLSWAPCSAGVCFSLCRFPLSCSLTFSLK